MASNFTFAEGEDTQQLTRDAESLLQQGWARDGDGMGVTKTFHFKSYFKAVVSSSFKVVLTAPFCFLLVSWTGLD
jgi:pterin-4a-carbinolamine dehydratase